MGSEQDDGVVTKVGTTEFWIENKMTGCHGIWDKNWNNRSWYRNRIQSKLMDGHNSWKNNWYSNRVQNKMTDCHENWNNKLDHKLVPQLDSEQADGWSQHQEQKLALGL